MENFTFLDVTLKNIILGFRRPSDFAATAYFDQIN